MGKREAKEWQNVLGPRASCPRMVGVPPTIRMAGRMPATPEESSLPEKMQAGSRCHAEAAMATARLRHSSQLAPHSATHTQLRKPIKAVASFFKGNWV
jgi:hypothetical protein